MHRLGKTSYLDFSPGITGCVHAGASLCHLTSVRSWPLCHQHNDVVMASMPPLQPAGAAVLCIAGFQNAVGPSNDSPLPCVLPPHLLTIHQCTAGTCLCRCYPSSKPTRGHCSVAAVPAGQLPVSKLWTANLELPVCLLGTVLPKDFNR